MSDWLQKVFTNIEECNHLRNEIKQAATKGYSVTLTRPSVVLLDRMLSDWRDGMEYKLNVSGGSNH